MVGKGHQHTTPLFLESLEVSGTARALDRLSFTSKEHDESWLQELIYRFPQLLPVQEIEPAFGTLVPVCMELPTSAGSVDNLYVTETGNLAIAECKLWRNPEARRQVVAQIIDYAHSMAKWAYEDLERAISSGTRPDGEKLDGGLYSLIGEDTDLDEGAFHDTVSRNLRLGRILLLIVGDGIREGVETLADYLQSHAGFHFTLGIVEMPIFALPDQGYLVQPRVLARTVNIERGIVRFSDGQVTVEPPSSAESMRGRTISEEQLREALSANAPEVLPALEGFQGQAEDLGIFVEPGPKSLQVRWRGPNDVDFGLAGVTPEGRLQTRNVNWRADDIGRVDLAHSYLTRLASLIGGQVRKLDNPRSWYIVDTKGNFPDAIDLLSRRFEWLTVIQWYIGELSKAIEANSP